ASLLQTEANLGEPVVVFTGPPKGQGTIQETTPTTQVASSDAKPVKPAKPDGKIAAAKPGPTGPAIAAASTVPWTSLSPAALAASPPSDLGATPVGSSQVVPLPRARPRLAARKAAEPVTQNK